jgi:membrane-bound metal-dependent hydrolase YbcI (DUF457 family)
MASKKTHIVIGVVAALAIYGIYKSSKNKDWDFWEMCGAAVLGGFAGALPDLLEPANSSYHRQFFHSFTLLTCFLFKEKAYDSLQLKEPHRSICNIFLTSYSSHLLADSITPRSLPLI